MESGRNIIEELKELREKNRVTNYENHMIELEINKIDSQIEIFENNRQEEQNRMTYTTKIELNRIDVDSNEKEEERKSAKKKLLHEIKKTKDENAKLELDIMKAKSELNRITKTYA